MNLFLSFFFFLVLVQFSSQSGIKKFVSQWSKEEFKAKIKNVECDFCLAILNELDTFLAENSTLTDIETIAVVVCEAVKAGGNCPPPYDDWQCVQVCEEAVHEFANEVDFLIIQYLDPSFVCWHFGFSCPPPLPTPQPTPIPDVLVDNQPRIAEGIGYIVHIPDIHYDVHYKPNTIADCGEPVCCRETDNNHNYSDHIYRGYYGSYLNCDASLNVLNSLSDYFKYNISKVYGSDIDFVLWVGDGVPHDVQNQSRYTHLTTMSDLNNWFLDTFADLPVYMILGNHEGMPVNQFQGPGYDSWLYSPMADFWQVWINNEYTAQDTVQPSQLMNYAGYYTTLIKPGFRLIGINTGYTEGGNYYLTWTHNMTQDMGSQLRWLNEVLETARTLNEDVLIMQHYPLISFEKNLAKEYYATYRKYQDIIKIVVAGHSHSDEFHVLGSFPEDLNNTSNYTASPFGVMLMAGSVTTYQQHNPHFRVYSYNRTTNEIIDFVQYRFNISLSNELLQPIWYPAYSMKAEYNLTSLAPEQFEIMIKKMQFDPTLFETYEYNLNGGLPVSLGLNSTICYLLSADESEYNYCTQRVYPSPITLDEYLQYNKKH